MKKGFIFVFIGGLILGALVVLVKVIELTREEVLILSSGVLSLLGGALGATGAYLIAKEQIKKQDSMRKMDVKLDKYYETIFALNEILSKIGDYARAIEKLKDSSKLVVIDGIKNQRNINEPELINLTSELFKHKTAFAMISLDYDYLIKFKNEILSIFAIEYNEEEPVEAEITRINLEIVGKSEEIERVIDEFEKEINIMLSN